MLAIWIVIGIIVVALFATAIADEGLYLTIWRKTALIPWQDVIGVGSTTLHWQQIPQLRIGEPCVATVALSGQLYGQMKGYLDAATAHARKQPAGNPSGESDHGKHHEWNDAASN